MTRSVPLTMKVPFCVISGMSPKKTSCSFMSRMDLDAGLGVLVVDREADRDLERSGVGHAALFALRLVVLQLQADWVAALVAEVGGVLVVGAALLAEHVARMERVGDDHGPQLTQAVRR